ncbi:MAG TPA: signal peptidase II [Pseudonocardiaceae bacterium]
MTSEETGAAPAPERRPRRVGLLALAAAFVLLADQVTKAVAVAALQGEPPARLLGGALYLDLHRNPGAAFSMATGFTWVFTLVAMVVVVAIIRLAPRLRSAGWAVGLGMVLGGAAGNLCDRLFRAPGPMRGHVVDFLSVFGPNGAYFPIFNLADSGLSVGGALIVLLALLGRDYDGTRTSDRRRAGDATTA